ncbi:thiamine diphosphokinase [Hoeflea prorocentri]|uniref:Thiamine diphosphokinase n=1 Tax=Hoeflea prorocentri TaxID=1922333 RepID=A0A9X3UMW2_9HYPH|nr:thiamine diphosphokinase [Hoeflea prorocentri]MCY6383559.1 thiamine diphosphokinase [Hoeflea prorocentri]MDA5401359.1 thiamine diphosphokinase [Hoeflea prorocentri]
MTQKTTFLILLGGSLEKTARLRGQIDGARVIAADGGMFHAHDLSVQPELWVGDFDSSPASLQQNWPGTPRKDFPAEKNATDGEIAVDEALALGANRIILAGALGGERSDHAFFHMALACRLKSEGTDVLLTSGVEEGWTLGPGSQTIDLPPASMFSILNFSDVSSLDVEGVRYPLKEFHLPFGSSRTISNVTEGPVSVRLGSGTALLLARPFDLSGT